MVQRSHIAANKSPSERRIHVEECQEFPAILYAQMTKTPQTSSKENADDQLDDAALTAIRAILTEDHAQAPHSIVSRTSGPSNDILHDGASRSAKRQLLPELASPVDDPEPHDAPTWLTRWTYSLGRMRTGVDAAPTRVSRAEVPEPGTVSAAKIKSYVPKPAYIALVALVLCVVLWPWLVLGLIMLSFLGLACLFVFVGYDGFWQGVIKCCLWYAVRRPERAVVLRGRLDRFAVAWDAVLDRFPEGTVDGLYLPDFGALASAEARHADAMERRLSGLQD